MKPKRFLPVMHEPKTLGASERTENFHKLCDNYVKAVQGYLDKVVDMPPDNTKRDALAEIGRMIETISNV